MKKDRHVKIFDTTLRDGQQCPGAGMDFERNIEYAKLAAKCGVDVLEAGFPAASRTDFEIVSSVAEVLASEADSPVVAGLCQMREAQVETTIRALEKAAPGKRRLHVYLPVDPALMDASLGKHGEDRSALVNDLFRFCKQSVEAGLEVEFSPEGYSRMGENFDFTTDLIRAAISGGATVINCPDTIGGACRHEGSRYFVELMNRHADLMEKEFPAKKITWSTHCHNDFGLAVENSMNAVFFGPATQIEGCFNGIGERAGNAALEQCIMIIKHFAHHIDAEAPYYTKINTGSIQELSDFVAKYMLTRQPHWPISGENAARHSSGGHTNAVLKNPLAYQPFDPSEVGKEISLVFGPLSGGNHAKAIIESHGYRCSEEEKTVLAQYIKDRYQDRRKGVTDQELMRAYFDYRKPIDAQEFDYGRSKNRSEVRFCGKFFGEDGEFQESLEGKDSALAVLKHLIDRKFPGTTIDSYNSESVGSGIHAASLSTIVISAPDGKRHSGRGEDQDIEISAMKALVSAINNAYIDTYFRIENDGKAKHN